MGVATTHYIMFGVAIRDKAEVKQFFQSTEDKYAFLDQYDDNGYQEEITPTASGLHIISDGMNGEYVVVGKIIQKGLDGLDFTQIPLMATMATQQEISAKYELFLKLRELDEQLGTGFARKDIQHIVFTHWH